MEVFVVVRSIDRYIVFQRHRHVYFAFDTLVELPGGSRNTKLNLFHFTLFVRLLLLLVSCVGRCQKLKMKKRKEKSCGSRRSSGCYDEGGESDEEEELDCCDDFSAGMMMSCSMQSVGGGGGFGGGPGRGGGGGRGRGAPVPCAPPPPPQAKPSVAQVEGGSGGMGSVSFVIEKPADIK